MDKGKWILLVLVGSCLQKKVKGEIHKLYIVTFLCPGKSNPYLNVFGVLQSNNSKSDVTFQSTLELFVLP